jgi:transcriptional regulator of aromatic amino acid metabolism
MTKNVKPMVITLHSTDFVGVSDLVLLQWLTPRDLRPNLLITCGDVEIEAITKHMRTFCAPPFHVCALPGTLRLPSATAGTLFLEDVAALTLRQQIVLNDWISAGRGRIGADRSEVQTVSMTSAPLWPLVEDDEFLEGLFFRLNVVCLEAQSTEDGHSTSSENRDIAIGPESFSHQFMPRRGPRRNQS